MARQLRVLSVALTALILATACAPGAAPPAPAPATAAPAVAASACPDANQPIKLGVVQGLTGATAFVGLPVTNAVKMHYEELNTTGGINGRKVELDVQDDRGDPKEGANIAQKFTSDPSIVAEIGPGISTVALAAVSIFTAAKMVALVPTSSHPDTTKNSQYIFRLVNQQVQLAGPYAKFLAERLKARRIAMVVSTDEFSKSNAEQVTAVLKDKYKNVEIVLTEIVPPNTTDFRPLLTKLAQLKPDLLYMIPLSPQEGSGFVKQLKQSGQKYVLVGGSSGLYSQVFLDLAGDAAEGIYVTAFFDVTDPRPAAKEFVARYQKKYGQVADQWAAFGDDAAAVMTQAIKGAMAGGKCLTRQGVADAMHALPAYDGLTGRKKFIEGSGDIEAADPSVLVIQNGRYRVLGPNEP